MNYRLILRVLGGALRVEALMMLPSLAIALGYGEHDWVGFAISIALLAVLGQVLCHFKPLARPMQAREGFCAVALVWMGLSFFGALPFVFSGAIPNLVDAVFECVSGFTTTGSTLVPNVEGLPHGILFWRSFTHWLGGMGILVMTLALLPSMGAGTLHLLRAESPGPTPGKLVPKLRQTAKNLYLIYLAMTVLLIALLVLMGMPLFDAFVHAFGTAGTGGFSSKNLSVGAYASPIIDWTIALFMLLFGVNFTVYFIALQRHVRKALKNEELRLYVVFVAAVVLLITFNISHLYEGFFTSLRHAAFQVSSIVTTTGYATVDFNRWPEFSKNLLILLMIVGACAGSTGGGLKMVRVLLLGKTVRREMGRLIHPRMVRTVKLDGKTVEPEVVQGTLIFTVAIFTLIILGLLLVSLDGFDFTTTLTAVITCVGNVGPGLGLVGPLGNFSIFSPASKVVLTLLMLLGRLEVFPMLLLLSPSMWRRNG